MPNWVQNIIKLEGAPLLLEELLNFVQSDDTLFDLSKVIPMPTHITDWCSWRLKNWETKFNASDVEWQDTTIKFQTPGSAPLPVIAKLAELFPEIRFIHMWSDETVGQNTGEAIYCSATGEYSVIFFDECSKSAGSIYFDCWGELD